MAYFEINTIRYASAMADWKVIISANLKKWRDAYGWSQDVLAEKAGCSKSVVRDLEAKTSGASLEMLNRLANALKIDIGQLLETKDARLAKNMSAIEIGEIAEGAPFPVLLDIVFKKVQSVPADIVEMSYYYKPSEAAWIEVRKILKKDMTDRRKPNPH